MKKILSSFASSSSNVESTFSRGKSICAASLVFQTPWIQKWDEWGTVHMPACFPDTSVQSITTPSINNEEINYCNYKCIWARKSLCCDVRTNTNTQLSGWICLWFRCDSWTEAEREEFPLFYHISINVSETTYFIEWIKQCVLDVLILALFYDFSDLVNVAVIPSRIKPNLRF